MVLMAGLTYPLSFGGFTSFIPALVPDDLLAPANALETTSFNSALVIGPALAGTLSAAFGPETSLLVEAGLALRRARADPAHPRPRPRRRPGAAATARCSAWRPRASARSSRSRSCAGSPWPPRSAWAASGLMTVAFPLFAVEHLGGERSDAGYMWAAFAAGSTLGALSLVRFQRRVPPERIVLAGYAIFGVAHADLAAGRLPARAAASLIAAAGMADGPALAAQFAVRQQVVPPSLYGQVFTTAAGLKVGSFAMGAGLAGPVVTGLGSAEAMLVAAAAQVTAAVVGVTLMRIPARSAASGVAGRLRLRLLAAEAQLLALLRLVGLELGRRQRLGRGSPPGVPGRRARAGAGGRRGALGRQVVRRAAWPARAAPASTRIAAQTSASRFWPSGRSNRRTTISTRRPGAGGGDHRAVAEGQVEALAERPRAQQREHAERHEDLGHLDERERAEGADREQHGADRGRLLLELSRRKVRTSSAIVERAAPAEAGVGLVPEADLRLALLPAQVDLAAVAQSGEVDQAAVEVAQHDLALAQLEHRLAQLEEPLRDDLAGSPPPLVCPASSSAARASASPSRSRAARILASSSATRGSSAEASSSE